MLTCIASSKIMARYFCIVFIVPTAVLVLSDKVCYLGSQNDPKSGVQSRWFLPYGDPCECTAIRLAGMNSWPGLQLAAPLENVTLSEDPQEIRSIFGCPSGSKSKCLQPTPLGLETGTIVDQQIRASSTYSGYLPPKARLNINQGCWIPDINEGCWIEVDLEEVTVVTGVISQGSMAFPGYRVTQYQVMYLGLLDNTEYNYKRVMDVNGNIQTFIGNLDDAITPITNHFNEVVMATKLRIVPTKWFGVGPGLRFELLGCRI